MAEEINLTFDTLFELLMREKSKDELQKLEQGFISHVSEYIKEKQNLNPNSANSQRNEKQIETALRVYKELMERREKKIMNLAHMASRVSTNIIDVNPMLIEEKQLYDDLLLVLGRSRTKIIVIPKKEIEVSYQVQKEYREEPKVQINEATAMLRFLSPVPRFLGSDLSVYGPYEAEDVANIPLELAELLIQKGRAENIALTNQ